MRAIVAALTVVTLGAGASCASVPSAQYPNDCPPSDRVDTTAALDDKAELGVRGTVPGPERARVERDRSNSDPDWQDRKIQTRETDRQRKLAERVVCPPRGGA